MQPTFAPFCEVAVAIATPGEGVVDLSFPAGLHSLKRREAQATPAAVTTAATSMATGVAVPP